MSLENSNDSLCRLIKLLYKKGYITETSGCISYRYGDNMIIPTDNMDPSSVNPNNLVSVRIADNSMEGEGKPATEYKVHTAIYRNQKSINAILHSVQINTITSSKAGQVIYPMVDDVAQLIGPSIRMAQFYGWDDEKTPRALLKALKRRNAALLENQGGIGIGASLDEVYAICQVLDKGAKCKIDTAFMGGGIPINPIECYLMRWVYLQSYSKAYKTNV